MKRGSWVYKLNEFFNFSTNLNEVFGRAASVGAAELYFSLNRAQLEDPSLPYLVGAANARGYVVEATAGAPEWITKRRGMLDYIDALFAYSPTPLTDGDTYDFEGLHLDIEPWIGSGEDYSWAPPLVETYLAARERLYLNEMGYMRLAADMSGVKMTKLAPELQRSMVSAVDKLVLMQYEATLTNVLARTRRVLEVLDASQHAKIWVAVRAMDFPSDSFYGTLTQIESALPSIGGVCAYVDYARPI